MIKIKKTQGKLAQMRSPLAGSTMIWEPGIESWLEATYETSMYMHFQPKCGSGMADEGM